MSKQEDFGRPEKPLEKTREIDNEARISKKAEIKRKFNRNQKRIILWDIRLSSLTSLVQQVLGWGSAAGRGVFLLPPIREQLRKGPSWIELILQTSRLANPSNTLIGDTFSSVFISEATFGNLTDHLSQFAINSIVLRNIPTNRANIYDIEWEKFDQESGVFDYYSFNWEKSLRNDHLSVT